MTRGIFPRLSIEARFWKQVQKTDSCWLWMGWKDTAGYAQITVWCDGQREHYGVHRFSYELNVGPIPEGLTIDHLCRVRHCVNPSHLEAVTMRENLMRGDTPAAINSKKTHCPYGHLLTQDWKQRICRTCRRERSTLASRARRARQHCQ